MRHIDSSPAEREKALEFALAQVDAYGRMTVALNRKPNVFSQAAVRLGRVPQDYKPLGETECAKMNPTGTRREYASAKVEHAKKCAALAKELHLSAQTAAK
jgi:hypothetical protein